MAAQPWFTLTVIIRHAGKILARTTVKVLSCQYLPKKGSTRYRAPVATETDAQDGERRRFGRFIIDARHRLAFQVATLTPSPTV